MGVIEAPISYKTLHETLIKGVTGVLKNNLNIFTSETLDEPARREKGPVAEGGGRGLG